MIIKPKQRKIAFLGGVSALLFFLSPSIADAGWVFGAAQTALQSLSEITGPLFSLVFYSFIAVLVGVALLWISTTLLDWVIDITPEALTVLSGEAATVVQVGWNFTSGIVNMLLMVLFVIVAISFILGTDSYGLKKALPKLIMVAFLVNFTLLFVGMGIDISNFLFNSIANQMGTDTGTMIRDAMYPLIEFGEGIWMWASAFLTRLVPKMLTPYLGLAVQAAWLLNFQTFLSLIIQYFVMGAVMIMMSGLLFLFFAILVMRIFIVQILAILSPIAFFCLILPSTEKWWKKWLEHLTEWLLYGVAFIFLIYVGLAFAPLVLNITRPVTDHLPWWLDWFGADEFLPYVVLLIYFAAIFSVCRNFVPSLAKTVIEQGKAAVLQSVAPMVGAWGKGSQRSVSKKVKDFALGETKDKEGSKTTRKDEWDKAGMRDPGGSIGERIKKGAQKTIVRRAQKAEGDENKRIKDEKKKLDDMSDEEVEDYAEQANRWKNTSPEADIRSKAASTVPTEHNDNRYKDKDKWEEARKKAKEGGVEKDFLKAYFTRYAQHTNKSQKALVEEIRKLAKKDDDYQKMASSFHNAYTSSDKGYKEKGEEAYKALLQQRDAGTVKGVLKNVKGDEGYKAVEGILKKELKSRGETKIDAKSMGKMLKELAPTFAKSIEKNIGTVMLNVDIPESKKAEDKPEFDRNTQKKQPNNNRGPEDKPEF